jgi:AcrR family transcriptional regulator
MPPRTPVTRERVLAEAVALADAEGLEEVSMRGLAARLDVVPMALYKHVTNKSDLLDGMAGTLIASYDPLDPTLGWRAAVRAQILSARRVLLAHPWARQVMESRTTRTPQVLGHMDRLSGLFIEGGLSADLTHHAMHALGHRIWGFSPEAFDDPESLQPPADPAAREAMFEMVRQRYPHIAMIALDAAGGDLSTVGNGCDEQFEFEFTLDLLLDAFERLHKAGWCSRR